MATFSTQTPEALNLDAEALQQVQYYLSAPFTLEFEETRSTTQLVDNRGVRSDRERFEQNIVFKRHLPVIAESIRPEAVVVRAADDIRLTFRPDSLLGVSLDTLLYRRDSLQQVIQAESLPPETDTLSTLLDSLMALDVPYLLAQFNDQPVAHDSSVSYRGQTYTVKYGYFDRARSFVQRDVPRLSYEQTLVQTKVREVEEVPGMTVDERIRLGGT